MKQGWEIKKLGDVLLKTETVDPTKNPNEEFIYLDVSSVNKETKAIENATVLFGKDAPSRARKLVRTNDVIFATVRPTHSRVTLITEEYDEQVCSTGYFVLRGRDFILNQYLFYFLLTDEFNEQMFELQKGASYPAVTDAEVKSILLHYPKSLPEQQRIVAILDEAFTAIAKAKANAQQNLKNSKELFESYLQALFENKDESWELNRLGDVCQINDGTHFSPKNSDDGDYMYITAKNIKPYFIDLTKISYISEKDHKEIYARCSPKMGDVLYIKDGATAGIAALNSLDEEFSLLSSVALLKCSPKIINTFLVHYMNSTIGKKNFLGYLDGAAITRLTLIKIKNVCFYLPPIETQQTIVQKLETLSAETKKLESIYQQKINDLEELKKSVLQKAFAGELTRKGIEV